MLSLALVILAQTSAPEDWIRPERVERVQRAGGRNGSGLAWFEFAPTSGAGLPTASNLCDTLTAAEKASVMPDGGSGFWCLNGDATMDPASTISIVAPTDAGTTLPAPVTMRVCPNGPDCASKSALEFSATLDTDQQGYRQTTQTNPFGTNDWTVCQHLQFGADWSTASYENTLFHGIGAGIDVLFQRQTGSGSWYVYVAGLARGAGTVDFGAPAIMCTTRVDSTQRIRNYLNGTSVYDTSSTGVVAGTTSIWKVGGYDTASAFPIKKGTRVFGTFFVNTALSDARIAAIARAVLADAPTGARGEALSETRASVQFCESSNGTGSLLPNNRPCVTRGGTTAAQGAFTQYALRTEELNDAAWADDTTVGAITVTANYAISPGGTLTAERLQINAVSAAQYSARYQTASCPAGTDTASVYVKAVSGTPRVDLVFNGGVSSVTASSSSWTRISRTSSPGGATFMGVGHYGIYGGAQGAIDILVWGANCTAGSSLRPYIPATTASVLTAAEVPYLTLTNAPALNSIEATVDTPASLPASTHFLAIKKDTNNRTFMNVNAGKLECRFQVASVIYDGLSSGSIPIGTYGVRLSCSYDGSNVIACINGTCNSTARAFTNFSGATQLYVATFSDSTGYEANPNYVIKAVKADPNPARFR